MLHVKRCIINDICLLLFGIYFKVARLFQIERRNIYIRNIYIDSVFSSFN